MTRDLAIARARSAVGHGTTYALGKGGFKPERVHPWTLDLDSRLCDCSGFVAWTLGVSRQNPHPAMPWLETTAVAHDAMGGSNLFAQVPWEDALPGDVLVWGDSKGKQGHIGLLVSRDTEGPLTVIHCSRGNYSETGDAIRETGVDLFKRHDAIAAKFLPMSGVGASDTGSA